MNKACGPAKLSRIEHHGSGWWSAPYWVAYCSDGRVKVIDP